MSSITQPNVVLFLADDLGPWALGAAGNPEIETPHLDALAAGGTRFTDFYCTSPVCSPARASLLTGELPSRHGVLDWILPRSADGGLDDFLAGRATYPEALATAGYRTGLFGKWHLGDASTPRAGFEEWLALEASHGPYQDAEFVTTEGKTVRINGYVTDVIADHAIDFLTSGDGRPSYASVHFTAPHHPWVGQHPDDLTGRYDDCVFDSVPQESRHPWTHPKLAPAVQDALTDPRPSLVGYFAAVTGMDRAIGRILAAIDAAGLRDDTVIIFLSDNGYSCGQHGFWGKGNGTFPLNLYQESVVVPMIISGPGLPSGRVCERPAGGYDLAPTILDLAGLDPGWPGPGRSLGPVLRGEATDDREVVVYDEYGAARMIRRGADKLIMRHPDGPDELYDLAADPGERTNLIDDPARVELITDLRRELAAWFAEHSDRSLDGRRHDVTGRGQGRRLIAPAPLGSRRGRSQVTFAHRGLCSRQPENTLPALAAAVPFADYCEIDVRVTSDEQLIIMHDATLRRTTDVATVFPDRADDPVPTFSLAEIERLDAGRWYDPAVSARVPTLRQALDQLIGSGCGALLELKTDSMELVAAELTELLKRHPGAPVAAASIDPGRSADLRRRLPELMIGVLFLDAETITDAEITGYADYADFLCFRSDRITAALVDRVHRASLMIMHNSNTRAYMDEGARAGADGTMTDYADRREESARGVDELMIEAEDLLGVCRTSGPAPRTRGNQGLGFKFSARSGLLVDLAPGEWLELPFVADRDRSELHAVVVRHPDGGVVDVALDGAPVASEVDLRGPSPSPQTIRVRRDLVAGPHRLRFTAGTGPATLMVDGFALRSTERLSRSTPDAAGSASRGR